MAPRRLTRGSVLRPAVGAACLLALVAAAAWALYAPVLASPQPRMDERIYLGAAQRLAAGGDPYDEPGFLYTPAFAHLLAALGDEALVALRFAYVLGLWALAGAALHGTGWAWPWRLAAALAVVASPLTSNGIGCGNLTVALAGPMLLAVATAPARPGAAGILAGAVNALKPLGVGALLVTVAPRRPRPGDPRRLEGWVPRFAAATMLAAAAGLAVGAGALPSMLRNSGGDPHPFNLSIHRALLELGAPVHPAWIFVASTAAGVALCWRRGIAGRGRVAVAGTVTLLGLPIVNASTFLLTMPAQLLALEVAARRGRLRWREGRRVEAFAEAALTGAAVVCVQGALSGVAAVGPFTGLVLLIPLAAATGLTLYGALLHPPRG